MEEELQLQREPREVAAVQQILELAPTHYIVE